jgi:putative sterol carrier protein
MRLALGSALVDSSLNKLPLANLLEKTMTALDIIQLMPTAFVAERASDVNASVQFNISEPVYVTIEAGECTVTDGTHSDPTASLTIEDSDLIDLLNGDLDGISAFMSGKLQVQGDILFAQKFIGYFDRELIS